MSMRLLSLSLIQLALCGCAFAQSPPAGNRAVSAELPVREVTVFKDGHAFVVRENALEVPGNGEVVLDELPQPVLGTFWPFALDSARVVSATAARTRVEVERTALDLRQLLEANVGAEVVVVDANNERTAGVLVGLPKRSVAELDRVDPLEGSPRLPEKGSVALIRNEEGTRAIPLERVRDVTFRGEAAPAFKSEELRDRLTLRLSFAEGSAAGRARVGVAYVQKGLRWIPSYKLDIDGAGRAQVELEATLVNDLIDLADTTVNLVIGVPRFEFAGHLDPIALQEVAAQVARELGANGYASMSNMLSNSLMTQSAAFSVEPSQVAPEPAVDGEASNEDLFVFTVRNVTLRKGERMVLPIASFALTYRDVYVLDVPVMPPMEVRANFDGQRSEQLAALLAAPKAMHVLRLRNDSKAPLTTAPALVLVRGKVLAQSLMTYTPVDTESDLPLTTAVDVSVVTTEKEIRRTPDAVKWNGSSFHRIDMAGAIELVNRKREPLELEVRRGALGFADEVGAGGKFEQSSLTEAWRAADRPAWWSWWHWPYWWYHWNGFARFDWAVTLAPGAKTTLDASWHYFSQP